MKKTPWCFLCALLLFVHVNALAKLPLKHVITVSPSDVSGLKPVHHAAAIRRPGSPVVTGYFAGAERGSNPTPRLSAVGTSCPADVVIAAASCSAKATVSWTEPAASFQDTIRIPQYLDSTQGFLIYMGALNGHGYYKSSGLYHWRVAKEIAEFIGDTSVEGHLVTITSAAESSFLINLTNGTGLTPWIGLYSTGRPGAFRWVTGEPYSFTKWALGEPNNNAGTATIVAEPYVHMYDIGIWNDQRTMNLRFMAEFEKPLLTYRQVSGPANGSQQSVGKYAVCYERTNSVTGEKDSCCFNVTVTCPPGASTTLQTGTDLRSADVAVNDVRQQP